jgi:FtsH-binding integral membrane protein
MVLAFISASLIFCAVPPEPLIFPPRSAEVLPSSPDPATARTWFLFRVYFHLAAAVALFVGLEVFFFTGGLAERIAMSLTGVPWLLVLGAFVLLSWLASLLASPARSLPLQYAGFIVYVILQSLIFVPLLYEANLRMPGVIQSAAQATLGGFFLLTAVVVTTGKDFSFLRSFLIWGGIFSLVAIVLSLLIPFPLGAWFSVAMILLAGASVLHTTSGILRAHSDDPGAAPVSAALQLFADIALAFWYVLRLFMSVKR